MKQMSQIQRNRRQRYLRSRYGVDLEHVEAVLAEQDGLCPGCEKPVLKTRVIRLVEAGMEIVCRSCLTHEDRPGSWKKGRVPRVRAEAPSPA